MARTPDLLTAALFYARLGWRVFPVHWPTRDPDCPCSCGNPACKNIGKHPRIGNWPENASADEATIRRWWKQWPPANIGVACGQGSNLWVLDVDLQGDGLEELQALWDAHDDWPDTVKQTTGSGGFHYFFAHAPGLANAVKFLPGLDVRTEGGLVVLPPSLHASGSRYQWSPTARPRVTPVAAAPAWLVDLARVKRAEPVAAGVAEPVAEGSRNDRLFRDACAMRRRGMDAEVILTALKVENEKYCRPPLEVEEVEDIARKAARYPPEAQVAPANGAGEAIGSVPSGAKPWATARSLMDKQLKPLQWIVTGIIPEGLTILGGRPKQGKSWGIYGVAIAVAAGGKAFGKIPVVQGEVLHLALEDSERRLQDRMRSLLKGEPIPEALDWAVNWPKLAPPGMIVSPGNPDCLSHIQWWLDEHPHARLVIADTLAKLKAHSKSNGNAYDEDYGIISPFQRIAADRGIGLVLVTHTRKPGASRASADFLDEITGSTGITGSADTIIGIQKTKNEQEVTMWVKGRDVDEQELLISWDRDTSDWTLLGSAQEYRRTMLQQACLQVLKDAPGALHFRVIAGRIGRGDKEGVAVVQTILWRLAQTQTLYAAGEGFYALVRES